MADEQPDLSWYTASGRPVDETAVVPPALVIVTGSSPGLVYVEDT